MKYIQKLVLVPIEKWEKIKGKDIDPVKEVTVKAAPQKSQAFQRKVIHPVNTLKVNNQEGTGKAKKAMTSRMFLYLSPKKRNKGNLLLHYLENSEDIKWNKNGELIYRGKIIPDSNVIELITHAIENDKSHPIGMKTFYKYLSKINIPTKIISNKQGCYIMKKTSTQYDDLWRPPGQLNKR